MSTPEDSTDIGHLYQEFSASFQADDEEAMRRVYRELLCLGRPRAEIVGQAVRLASNGTGFSNVPITERAARPPTVAALAGIRRIPRMATTGGVSLKAINESSDIPLPLSEDRGTGKRVIVRDVECTSDNPPEIIKEADADPKIGFLPRSTIPRFACALTGVAVALMIALALLANVSTAEKTTTPSLSTRNGQELLEAPGNATNAMPGTADVDTTKGTTAQLAAPLDKPGFDAKPGRTGVGSDVGGTVASIRPTSDPGSQTGVPGSVLRRPNSLISPDVLSQPQPAPTATASANIIPKQEPSRLSGDWAILLTRGDSLFGTGDLASARLFYERAANAGSEQAALRLGESYDPRFLERTHIRGARGDIAAAIFWYTRARDLGASEATILLDSISWK